MRRFLKGFYGEVVAVYVALLLAVGIALVALGTPMLVRYGQETDQRTNLNLAAALVPRFRTALGAGIAPAPFEQEARQVAEVRPDVGVYLLSETGVVEVHYPTEPLRDGRVELEPVRRFLAGGALPIFGDDPHGVKQTKPFSAAAFEIEGRPVILYVVLHNPRGSTTAQHALVGLVLVLLSAVGLGLFAFALLGRRLRTVTEAVAAFEQGNLDRRIDGRYRGEVGRLADAFNRMADVIAGHVRELRRQAHLRRESTAALVHDLRAPLAALGIYLERIVDRSDTLRPAELRRYAEIGAGQVKTANRLVNALFELSKLEVRQVEPEPEAFPLAELVQDVAVQFEPRAEAEDVRIESEQPAQPVRVYADPVLVERALTNLIENALRRTPAGGRVGLRVAAAAGQGQVRVVDTGPGIPPADVPRVFERFYRGEAPRRKGSAGLGLAIAKQLAELQGGTLDVEHTGAEGTTFLLTLPAAQPGERRTSEGDSAV